MRNTLGDLNIHLFAELERLGEEELKGMELQEEIDRARAITAVASKIIANGTLVLEAQKLMEERINVDKQLPKMLEG